MKMGLMTYDICLYKDIWNERTPMRWVRLLQLLEHGGGLM